LVELLAFWEGGVNTTHLSEYFGISRQQSGKYLKDYQTAHPGQLTYNASHKVHRPQTSRLFQQFYINGDVTEYLDFLADYKQHAIAAHEPELTNTSLMLPKRQVSPEIMRVLVRAIKQQKRIDVEYVSLSTPDNQGRII